MEDVEDCNEEDLVALDDAVASNEEAVEDGTLRASRGDLGAEAPAAHCRTHS